MITPSRPRKSAPASGQPRPAVGPRNRHVTGRVLAVSGLLEESIVPGRLHPLERLVEDHLYARFAL